MSLYAISCEEYSKRFEIYSLGIDWKEFHSELLRGSPKSPVIDDTLTKLAILTCNKLWPSKFTNDQRLYVQENGELNSFEFDQFEIVDIIVANYFEVVKNNKSKNFDLNKLQIFIKTFPIYNKADEGKYFRWWMIVSTRIAMNYYYKLEKNLAIKDRENEKSLTVILHSGSIQSGDGMINEPENNTLDDMIKVANILSNIKDLKTYKKHLRRVKKNRGSPEKFLEELDELYRRRFYNKTGKFITYKIKDPRQANIDFNLLRNSAEITTLEFNEPFFSLDILFDTFIETDNCIWIIPFELLETMKERGWDIVPKLISDTFDSLTL